MASPDFEFLVEESFTITGRGVGVFGQLRSGILQYSDCGYLHTAAGVIPIGQINVEYARLAAGGERVALLLRGLSIEQVPAGSLVRSQP
jgi:translation elongation factor EF-Tu-like GTPase